MSELKRIPYGETILPEKDTSRKSKLLKQPKVEEGTNSQLLLKNSLIPRL